MNLAEVLTVALPELPAQRAASTLPRRHPRLIAREQLEGGVPTVIAMLTGGNAVFRFSPDQWKVVELFDGQRSYQEISDEYAQQTGIVYKEEELRDFAD